MLGVEDPKIFNISRLQETMLVYIKKIVSEVFVDYSFSCYIKYAMEKIWKTFMGHIFFGAHTIRSQNRSGCNIAQVIYPCRQTFKKRRNGQSFVR